MDAVKKKESKLSLTWFTVPLLPITPKKGMTVKSFIAGIFTIVLLVVLYATIFHWNPFGEGKRFQFPFQPLEISVNPMEEFDFKSKEEILERRKQLVKAIPQLKAKSYIPSEEVFGSIADGKAWWGIDGAYYWGPGKKSLEGLSEESRFISNPYLFIGLVEPSAYVISKGFPPCESFYPLLLNLRWLPNRQVEVKPEGSLEKPSVKKASNRDPWDGNLPD